MKKEMKIVLPFYKIAYAVSFVVILSLIRGASCQPNGKARYPHRQGSRPA